MVARNNNLQVNSRLWSLAVGKFHGEDGLVHVHRLAGHQRHLKQGRGKNSNGTLSDAGFNENSVFSTEDGQEVQMAEEAAQV